MADFTVNQGLVACAGGAGQWPTIYHTAASRLSLHALLRYVHQQQ